MYPRICMISPGFFIISHSIAILREILRSYADYDTVLAARFVHFFLSEAVRLGHPPRIIDMGCGRGSYVEVFKSWGLPVMGIDGNLSIPWWDAVLVACWRIVAASSKCRKCG